MTIPSYRSHRGPRTIVYALGAAAALTIAACSSDGGTGTIRLSQDSPDLSPSADDRATSTSDNSATNVQFATFDGGTRSISEFSGQPLVINFFAAWCPSCIAEMPHLEAVFNEVDGDVAFLGLAQDALASDALELVGRVGVSYDIGWDPDLEVFSRFGGFAMPTTVFIDADGQVVEVFSGTLNADAIREKIEAIRA